jgi:preprotein translocase subunit YajC
VNSGFIVLILMVALLLWLFLFRPQRRRQQAMQAMVDHLAVGDEVLTAGGFYGTVVAIDEDEVRVELSPGNEARVAKRAIAGIIPHGLDDDEDEDEDEQAEDEPRALEEQSADGTAEEPLRR